VDRIPNFPRHYYDLGRSRFTPDRGELRRCEIAFTHDGAVAIPHGDEKVINGGYVNIRDHWNAVGGCAWIVRNMEFHNCTINATEAVNFHNCKFKNCYLGDAIEELVVVNCQFESSVIRAEALIDSGGLGMRSTFDKCYIRLLKAWMPEYLKDYKYKFTKYIYLLRMFKNEHLPGVEIRDRWHEVMNNAVGNIEMQIEDGKPVLEWKGPLDILWKDYANVFRDGMKDIDLDAGAALAAADKFLSNNCVSLSSFRKITYEWAMGNR
jgi:hypothetical protein